MSQFEPVINIFAAAKFPGSSLFLSQERKKQDPGNEIDLANVTTCTLYISPNALNFPTSNRDALEWVHLAPLWAFKSSFYATTIRNILFQSAQ